MKRFLLILASLFCFVAVAEAQGEKQPLPKMFAHRGCWSKVVPENSIPAIGRAARHGYMGIELDVKLTKDGKMVIMHDKWLNRTCRNASDYSKLSEKVSVSSLTFKELRNNYVLASSNPEYRTQIPTLEEMLKECKRHKIIPMLHSKYVESYRLAQKIMGDDWICFTNNVEGMKECRNFSKCLILYGIKPDNADHAFELLPQLGGKVGVSSMQREALTRERIKRFRELGYEVQASVYRCPREAYAVRDGVTMLLSDHSLMPDPSNNPTKVVPLDAQLLAQGETLEIKADNRVADGGCAIEIEFEGTMEISFDKEKSYTLHNGGNHCDRIGMRYTNRKGTVKLHGVDGCKINSAKIYFYEF
jgi:hypothetical protein